jgi:hypothetical protein
MNLSDDMYLRMINHLTQDETDEERTAIELLLSQDEDLQREWEELKQLQSALKRHKILQMVNKAHEEIEQEAKVVRLRKTTYIWLAAASVALICGFFGFSYFHQNQQLDSLYTFYNSPNQLVINAPNDSLYQVGMEYLQQNQPQKAIETLSQSHTPEAQWYLALAYLKAHDKKNAIITLQPITKSPQHLFSDKAGQLLKELEK